MCEPLWPWESGAGFPLAARLDLGLKLGRAVGEQALDRCLENVGKQERIVESRDLGARLPARNLRGRPMTEKPRNMSLRKLPLLPVAPQAIRDGSLMY